MATETITIEYSASVKVPAGWRSVAVTATAEKTGGFAVVSEVLTIDGETPAYGQSRTGARRQEFNGLYWAAQEVGKRKRVSACTVI